MPDIVKASIQSGDTETFCYLDRYPASIILNMMENLDKPDIFAKYLVYLEYDPRVLSNVIPYIGKKFISKLLETLEIPDLLDIFLEYCDIDLIDS